MLSIIYIGALTVGGVIGVLIYSGALPWKKKGSVVSADSDLRVRRINLIAGVSMLVLSGVYSLEYFGFW